MNECLLCGHNGRRGERDAADGDWYCRICIDTAPIGELPLSVVGDSEETNGGSADA